MTERMVRAVSNPHVDILGHCTGRLIGKRDPSAFDPDTCSPRAPQFHTAVEINCRPERLDPPRPLLQQAIDHGCWFSIDSDAHSTGQLEWQPHGLRPGGRDGRAARPGDQHPRPRWTSSVGSRGSSPIGFVPMSKKTKKRKARLRRSKANHGKRPNMGRG